MFNATLMFVMNALMAALTPDKVKQMIQAAVSAVQAKVQETESKLDDAFIPASNLVLAALQVPGPDGMVDISWELKKLFVILKDHKNLFIDTALDYVEDTVAGTVTEADDIIVLPLCKLARNVLNVPDNDEPTIQPDPPEAE